MATLPLTLRKRFTGREVALEITDQLQHEDEVDIGRYSSRSKWWWKLPRCCQPTDLDRSWNWTMVEARRAPQKKLAPQASIWVLRRASGEANVTARALGVIVLQATNSPAHPAVGLVYVSLVGVHPTCRSLDFGLFRWPGEVRGVAVALLKFASDRAKTTSASKKIGLHADGRSEALFRRLGLTRMQAGDTENGSPYFEGVVG